jgi:hypothetical protein
VHQLNAQNRLTELRYIANAEKGRRAGFIFTTRNFYFQNPARSTDLVATAGAM